MSAEQHYDESYFTHYQSIQEFGGWAELTKFESYIRPTDTVVDFGCSGGYLLDNITCARKIGVELNPSPRAIAQRKGYEVYERAAHLPDGIADVIVSSHVLEHTTDPLSELVALREKLKPGGKLVIVVPCESHRVQYRPDNVDFHLFTWSPMNLGNLLKAAGYNSIESGNYVHRWPPRIYRQIARIFGRQVFEICCRITGWLRRRDWSQVRAVAVR